MHPRRRGRARAETVGAPQDPPVFKHGDVQGPGAPVPEEMQGPFPHWPSASVEEHGPGGDARQPCLHRGRAAFIGVLEVAACGRPAGLRVRQVPVPPAGRRRRRISSIALPSSMAPAHTPIGEVASDFNAPRGIIDSRRAARVDGPGLPEGEWSATGAGPRRRGNEMTAAPPTKWRAPQAAARGRPSESLPLHDRPWTDGNMLISSYEHIHI